MKAYEWWESGERMARWRPKAWSAVCCVILVLVQERVVSQSRLFSSLRNRLKTLGELDHMGKRTCPQCAPMVINLHRYLETWEAKEFLFGPGQDFNP